MEQHEIGTYTFQPRNKFGRWMRKQTRVSARFLVATSLTVAFVSFCVAAVAIGQANEQRNEMVAYKEEVRQFMADSQRMMVKRFGGMIVKANEDNQANWTLLLDSINLTAEMASETQKMVAKSK